MVQARQLEMSHVYESGKILSMPGLHKLCRNYKIRYQDVCVYLILFSTFFIFLIIRRVNYILPP